MQDSTNAHNLRALWKQIRANIKQYRQHFDKPLLILTAIVIVFGLVMVYSTTRFNVYGTTARSFSVSHVFKQSAAIIAGGIASLVISALPIKWFGHYKTLLSFHVIVIAALFGTLVMGVISKGARSWIQLGPFNFQPSEFTKISIVLLFSHLIYHTLREYRGAHELRKDLKFKVSVASILVAIILIALQPDLGMIIILGGTMFIMLMVNRFGKKGNIFMYGVITGIFILAQLIARVFGSAFSRLGLYQLERLGSFADPFPFVEDAGYQLVRAYIAFSRGGWFGTGIGQGLTNQAQLPERHNDFIFAIVAEETGFVGAMLLLASLFAIVIRLFLLAYRSKNIYHRCVLSGAGTVYLVQTLVNVGGALGVLPLTGVTLPFVSYGGSSMIMCIMLLAVAQRMIVADNIEMTKEVAHGI